MRSIKDMVLHGYGAWSYTIVEWEEMRCKETESEKESRSRSKQVYRLDEGKTRLAPALVVIAVVAALRAALLAVAPATPGRGLVFGGGFVVGLVLVVPRVTADDEDLVGDVGGLGFCRLVMVFSLSSPAAVAVRVRVVGFTGPFSCGLFSAAFALPLSLTTVVGAGFLASTFAFVLSVAEAMAVFLVADGLTFRGDVGVFLTFRGGSGSISIEIPSSSSSVISLSTSLPFPISSRGLAQSSSIKVASGARFSTTVSTAIESKGSLKFSADMARGPCGGDGLSTIRTRLRGLGLTGEYA